MQDAPTPAAPSLNLTITGVNASEYPTVVVSAEALDQIGQPIFGLGAENFSVVGELAGRANIVRVENITDDNLTFDVVLALDTSSSMAGTPFERAREAALRFVEEAGANARIAIVTFDNSVRVVQEFTSDRDTLVNTINNLGFGGQTRLYDAALLAVNTAANGGNPRRVVILLSDGAEFGGRSQAARTDALAAALGRGVPVYTIGLGFGFDRTYLQQISGGTSANFDESPTADELITIYRNLASKLRSQYVITLDASSIPVDGNTYGLDIQAISGEAIDVARAELRAPIPVPIVSLGELPSEPIAEPIEIPVTVLADDPVSNFSFSLVGAGTVQSGSSDSLPFVVPIDPITLPPGDYVLDVEATDSTGDSSTATGVVQIAALPPSITLSGLPEAGIELTEAVDVTVEVGGQTAGVVANYSLDGGEVVSLTEAPFSFQIDPTTLAPGEHVLAVEGTNESALTSSQSFIFNVAALPPSLTIEGVSEDEELAVPTTINLSASGQTPIDNLTATLNGETIFGVAGSTGSFVIDPETLEPAGRNELTITATDQAGTQSSQTVIFGIAALPPTVTITGIELGEALDTNRNVVLEISSQTPVSSAVFSVDGTVIATDTESPFSAELDVAALGDGPHVLSVEVNNTGGRSAVAETAFSVALPTATPTTAPSNTPEPATATHTPDPAATTVEEPSATPVPPTVVQIQAGSTREAAGTLAAAAALTAQAQSTVFVDATQDADATAIADVAASQTAQAQQTLDAQAQGTQAAQAALDRQATQTAQAVAQADALATTNAAAGAAQTAQAQLTQDALVTQQAGATQTAEARVNAQATRSANTALTSTAQAEATNNAQGTLDAQATGTADARATTDAESTASASVSGTENAPVTVTASVEAPTDAPAAATDTTQSNTPTVAPSSTPTTLTTEFQGQAADNASILPVALCIGLLIVLVIIAFLAGRRRNRDERRPQR
ncbi:MAG: VWA domain-containing protein [Anaerolineae bacterium]|nr:VWA domain-containing protein [Anaerolineae bacterium]